MSPGRRTNRKNLRSCQRTILLYSFCKFSQSKIALRNTRIFNRVQPVHKGMTEFSATPQIAFRRTSTGRGFLCDSSVEIQESADREQGHFNVKITHFPRRARDLGLDVGRNHHLFVECGSMGITRNLPLGFVSAELRSAHTRWRPSQHTAAWLLRRVLWLHPAGACRTHRCR